MADVHTPEQRSYNMSRIRGSGTKPELLLKNALRGTRLRYHPKMKGNPDFASRKNRLAVFVDGCFWHGCPRCYTEPVTRKDFWKAKIERNRKRDMTVTKALRKDGWKVLRIWEHDVKKNTESVVKKIRMNMNVIA